MAVIVQDALGGNPAETATDGESQPLPEQAWGAVLAGEIHVWRAKLGEPDDGRGPDRSRHHAREQVQARRRRSWAAVRQVLSGYLGCEPSDVRFELDGRGKPLLAPPHDDLRFSLSRCGDRCLIAVTTSAPVGVDLERVRPMGDVARMAERVLAGSEASAIRSLQGDARLRAFFACWTRKEAYAKAIGLGLALPFNQFSVAIGDDLEPALLTLAGDDPRAWTLRALELWPGYVGAVATRMQLDASCVSMRMFRGAG